MARTLEGAVKARVKKMLNEAKAYHYWPVGNGMGSPTLDCLGCHHGRFFAIETKAPGKKPTPRQEGTIREIHLATGMAFVIDGTDGSYDLLKMWLEMV
jgi:hypothetical protein